MANKKEPNQADLKKRMAELEAALRIANEKSEARLEVARTIATLLLTDWQDQTTAGREELNRHLLRDPVTDIKALTVFEVLHYAEGEILKEELHLPTDRPWKAKL